MYVNIKYFVIEFIRIIKIIWDVEFLICTIKKYKPPITINKDSVDFD